GGGCGRCRQGRPTGLRGQERRAPRQRSARPRRIGPRAASGKIACGEATMDRNLRPYVAEFLGTFVLVFVSAGIVLAAHLASDLPLGPIGIAVAQGCVLAAALSATVNVSGGFLNPAVTITLWV